MPFVWSRVLFNVGTFDPRNAIPFGIDDAYRFPTSLTAGSVSIAHPRIYATLVAWPFLTILSVIVLGHEFRFVFHFRRPTHRPICRCVTPSLALPCLEKPLGPCHGFGVATETESACRIRSLIPSARFKGHKFWAPPTVAGWRAHHLNLQCAFTPSARNKGHKFAP